MLHTHVVAAAKSIHDFYSVEKVEDLARMIIVNFMRLLNSDNSNTSQDLLETNTTTNVDGVYVYATDLLSLGLVWHGFHDAIREGDGNRILRYWKILLVIFKCTNCGAALQGVG